MIMAKLINDNILTELLIKNTPYELEAFREKREKLLLAFDIYKANVLYGLIAETAEEHIKVVQWYQRLLNCDGTALDEIPNSYITKYTKDV
jgi:hypothetical protein